LVKVFILSDKHDVPKAKKIIALLRSLEMDAAGYYIGPRWWAENRRLDEIIAPATHYVVVYSENSIASSWLAFLAGYALASGKVLLLYRPSRYPGQAPFLAPFFLVLSAKDLADFLQVERREWENIANRRKAREALLEQGLSFRGSAFAEAIAEGDTAAAALFVQAGLPPDSRDKKGVPVLCLAARTGNRAALQLLLAAGANLDAPAEDRGNSALMDAVAAGHRQIVTDLIDAGADVNLQSKDGQNALVIAVGKNDLESTRLLLENGAEADSPDKLGFTARKYAALFHNPEIVALFDTHRDQEKS